MPISASETEGLRVETSCTPGVLLPYLEKITFWGVNIELAKQASFLLSMNQLFHLFHVGRNRDGDAEDVLMVP
jgi:hypothetical protein